MRIAWSFRFFYQFFPAADHDAPFLLEFLLRLVLLGLDGVENLLLLLRRDARSLLRRTLCVALLPLVGLRGAAAAGFRPARDPSGPAAPAAGPAVPVPAADSAALAGSDPGSDSDPGSAGRCRLRRSGPGRAAAWCRRSCTWPPCRTGSAAAIACSFRAPPCTSAA